MSGKKKIQKIVNEKGYVVVNVDNLYYYTVGLHKFGLQDIFGVCQYPFGFFQVAVSKLVSGEAKPNTPFLIHEYKVPACGLEPSRVKSTPLAMSVVNLINRSLAGLGEVNENLGFQMLLGPDLNNLLNGEQGCAFTHSPNTLVQTLIGGVKKDMDKALNEAEKIRKALGVD